MTENITVKVETVLTRNKESATLPGAQAFSPHIEDEEAVRLSVVLTDDCWSDLGKPNVLTVTVEPGDRLN